MKTGVIGLGAMGMPMALNLHRAGHLYSIWNRTRSKAETVARETGCLLADTIKQLAGACEMIITCVSRDTDVLEIINAIATSIKPDTIVVDTSTVSADTAKKAAARLSAKGACFL